MTRFSIIVPIYNVEKYLENCIDSIIGQTYRNFEVILVDDGSTDRSHEICTRYVNKDPRIRLITKANGGIVSARNAGLLSATGEYICYVDGDDYAKPNMLKTVNDILEKYEKPLDMVLFAADEIFKDHVGAVINSVDEGLYDKAKLEKEIYPYLLTDRGNGFHANFRIFAHTWDKVYRRELQLEHYVRDERIRMLTDVPLTYECILYSNNIYICNEQLYCYNRTNETSVRAIGKKNFITKNSYYLAQYMQKRLRGYNYDIDRQLNEYPVLLIIATAMDKMRNGTPIITATNEIRKSLKESELLQCISLRGLPLTAWLFTGCLKIGFIYLAILFCKLKTIIEDSDKTV